MGVMIPDDVKPTWRCVVGDKVYEYPSGSIQEDLPDEVFSVLINILASKPREAKGNVVTFQYNEAGTKIKADMTPGEVLEKMEKGETVFAYLLESGAKKPLGIIGVNPRGYALCVGLLNANNGVPKYIINSNHNYTEWVF